MELKKMKNILKNRETDGYGMDKRPEIEKLKKETRKLKQSPR